MSGQSSSQRSWLGIAAGGATLLAIVTHQLAIAAYPTYFSGIAGTPTRDAWDLGWPWRFATMSMSGELSRLSALPLGADLVISVALVVGVVVAVGDWTRGRSLRPVFDARLIAIIGLTMVGWLLLAGLLRVPVAVFFGWAALVLIFLAIPCAAYALSRFSLRGLFIAITVLCIVLAAVVAIGAWRAGRERTERLARAAVYQVDPSTYEFGIAKTIETTSGGRVVAWDYDVVDETTRVPLALGTVFGVEYTVVGDRGRGLSGPAHLSLIEVWHYPGELVDNPFGVSARQSERNLQSLVGRREVSVMRLRSEPYLLPGEWKFELWLDAGGQPGERRKLLEQTFVLKPP